MTIARPQILLTMAFGLIISGFSTASAIADDTPGQSPAAGHDHDAMKAEMKIGKVLATLAPADRKQAEAQRFCPIKEYSRLGGMDAPPQVVIEGTPIFVCCKGCADNAVKGGKETLARVKKLTEASAALATMPAKDRAAAEAQKYCAIAKANKNFLGSMGAPIKIGINGQPVFLCCKSCVAKAKANPVATLAKVASLKKAGTLEGHDHDEHKH